MSARQQGFTLAEMLVVLVILALTTAMVLPVSRRAGESAAFDLFVREVAFSFRKARLQAIGENRDAVVSIDLKARAIGLGDAEKPVIIPEDAAVEIVTDRAGIGQASAVFRFFPDGSATGGHVNISRNGLGKRIDVDWLTGKVSIRALGSDGNAN